MTTKTHVPHGPVKRGPAVERTVRAPAATSGELFRQANRGKRVLSQSDRNQISPDYLFALALTQKIKLTTRDKQRLRIQHLWQLALMQRIELTLADRERLPADLLERLEAGLAQSNCPAKCG